MYYVVADKSKLSIANVDKSKRTSIYSTHNNIYDKKILNKKLFSEKSKQSFANVDKPNKTPTNSTHNNIEFFLFRQIKTEYRASRTIKQNSNQ